MAGEKDMLTIFLYDEYGNAIVTNPGLRVALSFKVLRPAFATEDNDGGYIAPVGAIADVTPGRGVAENKNSTDVEIPLLLLLLLLLVLLLILLLLLLLLLNLSATV